jgi:hypothetical protein
MIPLDDPQWGQMKGGYQIPYDPSSSLRKLERGENGWTELWKNLHHQGAVGDASYATVPHLVAIMKRLPERDVNFYSLVSTIEIERHRRKNPPLYRAIEASYSAAWADILDLAISDLKSATDPALVQSILAAIVLAKGDIKLGALLGNTDRSEIDEILDHYDAWSELYDDRKR